MAEILSLTIKAIEKQIKTLKENNIIERVGELIKAVIGKL